MLDITIGTYLLCQVNFMSYNPDIKRNVNIEMAAKCKVIDNRFIQVGNREYSKTPFIVDCSQDTRWLNPIKKDMLFLFYREEGDCTNG